MKGARASETLYGKYFLACLNYCNMYIVIAWTIIYLMKNGASPSIELAKKNADSLEVSLAYLIFTYLAYTSVLITSPGMTARGILPNHIFHWPIRSIVRK